MIEYIKGQLIEKNPTHIVVETAQGIGYFINISLSTYGELHSDHVKIFTHQVIKEDSHQLFGFLSLYEREIFRKLISVSGIGAGTARSILSSLPAKEVATAIQMGDANVFKNVKGIGLKTAQRIIIDLKGRVDLSEEHSQINGVKTNTSVRTEALDALEILGFARKNCEKAVDTVLEQYPETTIENLIKLTLKSM